MAERLQLVLKAVYKVSREHELLEEIQNLTGVVVILCEHKAIVTDLIPTFKGGQTIPGVPTEWDG